MTVSVLNSTATSLDKNHKLKMKALANFVIEQMRIWIKTKGFKEYKFVDQKNGHQCEWFIRLMDDNWSMEAPWRDDEAGNFLLYGRLAKNIINRRKNNVIGSVRTVFRSKFVIS